MQGCFFVLVTHFIILFHYSQCSAKFLIHIGMLTFVYMDRYPPENVILISLFKVKLYCDHLRKNILLFRKQYAYSTLRGG